jgi:hypothetical protein
VVVLAALAVSVGSVQAASITIPNFSFQSNSATDGLTSTGHASWNNVTGSDSWSLTFNPANAQFAGATGTPGTLPGTADGDQCLVAVGGTAVLLCNLSGGGVATFQAHKNYTLTVAFGTALDRDFGDSNIGFIDITSGGAIATCEDPQKNLPGYSYNAWNRSGTFTDVSFSINSDDYIVPGAESGNEDGYIAEGDAITLMLLIGSGVCMDNVRLTVADVPEPSTLALLAAGLIGMLAYGWRKHK